MLGSAIKMAEWDLDDKAVNGKIRIAMTDKGSKKVKFISDELDCY